MKTRRLGLTLNSRDELHIPTFEQVYIGTEVIMTHLMRKWVRKKKIMLHISIQLRISTHSIYGNHNLSVHCNKLKRIYLLRSTVHPTAELVFFSDVVFRQKSKLFFIIMANTNWCNPNFYFHYVIHKLAHNRDLTNTILYTPCGFPSWTLQTAIFCNRRLQNMIGTEEYAIGP
jgi:hypothetical protein